MKLNRPTIIQLVFVATLVTVAYHVGRVQSMIEEYYALGAPLKMSAKERTNKSKHQPRSKNL